MSGYVGLGNLMASGLAAVLWSFAGASTMADDRTDSVADVTAEGSSACDAPYCGIASACGALRVIGVKCEWRAFLRPEYVGSEDGSTAAELIRAVRDHGGEAAAFTGMTADMLRAAEQPVILHVSGRLQLASHKYDHWMLFLGTHGAKARIVDYPDALEEVPFAEVLARWDGMGLVVSKAAGRPPWVLSSGCMTFGAWALALAGAFLFYRYPLQWAAQRLAGRVRTGAAATVLQSCLLLAPPLLLGIAYHGVAADGMLANIAVCRIMALDQFPALAPHIGLRDLLAKLGQGPVALIDARNPDTFRRGCIPNAVNIPRDLSAADRAQALRHVNKTVELVVYCQSEQCPWSDELARSLIRDGYSHISVFSGGWQEWRTSMGEGDHD